MKKTLFLLSIFLTYFNGIKAQNWDSLSSGLNGFVHSLAVYKGELYAGGNFSRAGHIKASGIAKWNDTTWSTVGLGVTWGTYPDITSLIVYKGNLYAGGYYMSAGKNCAAIAMWNGTTWTLIGTVTGVTYPNVSSMAVYNGILYVGGGFTSVNGISTNNIAMWNGTTWTSLGSGLVPSNYAYVFSMCSFDSILYVAGEFDTADGVPCNNIAQWNGTKWSAVGKSIANTDILSLCIYDSKLYAGGSFTALGGSSHTFDWWDGSTWSSVGLGALNSQSGGPWSMMAANGGIVIAGTIGPAGSGNNYDVEYWNGNKVDSIGSGFVIDSGMNALCMYNNKLYAGGSEMYSGNTLINHIARWNHPLPVGINSITLQNNSISIFPNPSKGLFTIQSASVNINVKVEVYNMLGEVVYMQTLQQIQGDHTIDLSNETDGIYLFRMLTETGNLVSTGKLIIQK